MERCKAQIFGFPGVSADAWPFTHPALSEVGRRFSLGDGRYECYTTGFSLNIFFVGGDFFYADTNVCLELSGNPASKVHSRPEGFILTSAGSLQDYDCHI